MRPAAFFLSLAALAAPCMASENCRATVIVDNRWAFAQRSYEGLEWGKWRQPPPGKFSGGETITVEAWGANGSTTGVEGSFSYARPYVEPHQSFTIRFNIDFNTYGKEHLYIRPTTTGTVKAKVESWKCREGHDGLRCYQCTGRVLVSDR